MLPLCGQRLETYVPTQAGRYFEALSWSADGRIYTPDFVNGLLYRVNPDSSISLLLDSLSTPLGGTFDASGNFYFGEAGRGGSVHRLDRSGRDSVIASGFGQPVSTLLDSSEQLIYMTDYQDRLIARIDLTTGQADTLVRDTARLAGPDALIWASDSGLIVANFDDNRLHRVSLDGVVTPFATLDSSGNSGYLINYGDDYLVAGYVSHRIYHVTQQGEVTIWAGTGQEGSTEGTLLDASLSYPNGLALSPSGDTLLITTGDGTGGRVRMVTGLTRLTSVPTPTALPALRLRVFPNPAVDRITVEFTPRGIGPLQFSVYATDGRLVWQGRRRSDHRGIQQSELSLPGNLPAGMYRLKVSGRQERGAASFLVR